MSQTDAVNLREHISLVMGAHNGAESHLRQLSRAALFSAWMAAAMPLSMGAVWSLQWIGVTLEQNGNSDLLFAPGVFSAICLCALVPLLVIRRIVSLRRRKLSSLLEELSKQHPDEYREADMRVNPGVWKMMSMYQDVLDSAPLLDGRLVIPYGEGRGETK